MNSTSHSVCIITFSHEHMRNLLGKQWPVKLWNMALFQCETEPLQAWNFSASLIFITWLVRWKSRLCPPRRNSWVRHVEDSSHDAVIFHSSVCGCQTLQMSILCLLRMQGSPNIFFDIVVGIGIHKEQGGILLWLVACQPHSFLVLVCKVWHWHIDGWIRAPSHILWTCNFIGILANYGSDHRIPFGDIILDVHPEHFQIQHLVCWWFSGRQIFRNITGLAHTSLWDTQQTMHFFYYKICAQFKIEGAKPCINKRFKTVCPFKGKLLYWNYVDSRGRLAALNPLTSPWDLAPYSQKVYPGCPTRASHCSFAFQESHGGCLHPLSCIFEEGLCSSAGEVAHGPWSP